jgi:hypothetical protein
MKLLHLLGQGQALRAADRTGVVQGEHAARLLGERVHRAADVVDVGHSSPFRLSK